MFFTILSLCTAAVCNDYYIDNATTEAECVANTNAHTSGLMAAWDNQRPQALADYLFKRFEIDQSLTLVSRYDLTCQFIPDNLIP